MWLHRESLRKIGREMQRRPHISFNNRLRLCSLPLFPLLFPEEKKRGDREVDPWRRQLKRSGFCEGARHDPLTGQYHFFPEDRLFFFLLVVGQSGKDIMFLPAAVSSGNKDTIGGVTVRTMRLLLPLPLDSRFSVTTFSFKRLRHQ